MNKLYQIENIMKGMLGEIDNVNGFIKNGAIILKMVVAPEYMNHQINI
jgi:hypothetical protein